MRALLPIPLQILQIRAQTYDRQEKFLALVRTTRDFDLGFEARLVYSFMVFRLRQAPMNGTSQITVARFLGLDRGETIPKALEALRIAGLVLKSDDGLWEALEPKGVRLGWFGWQDFSVRKPWYSRFKYYNIYFPAPGSRLTLRQIVLYFAMWSLAYQPKNPGNDFIEGQTIKGFAGLLCVSRPTIDEALEILQSEGLIRYARSIDGADIGVRLFPIRPEQEQWFRDAKERRISEVTGRGRYPGLFDDPYQDEAHPGNESVQGVAREDVGNPSSGEVVQRSLINNDADNPILMRLDSGLRKVGFTDEQVPTVLKLIQDNETERDAISWMFAFYGRPRAFLDRLKSRIEFRRWESEN